MLLRRTVGEVGHMGFRMSRHFLQTVVDAPAARVIPFKLSLSEAQEAARAVGPFGERIRMRSIEPWLVPVYVLQPRHGSPLSTSAATSLSVSEAAGPDVSSSDEAPLANAVAAGLADEVCAVSVYAGTGVDRRLVQVATQASLKRWLDEHPAPDLITGDMRHDTGIAAQRAAAAQAGVNAPPSAESSFVTVCDPLRIPLSAAGALADQQVWNETRGHCAWLLDFPARARVSLVLVPLYLVRYRFRWLHTCQMVICGQTGERAAQDRSVPLMGAFVTVAGAAGGGVLAAAAGALLAGDALATAGWGALAGAVGAAVLRELRLAWRVRARRVAAQRAAEAWAQLPRTADDALLRRQWQQACEAACGADRAAAQP